MATKEWIVKHLEDFRLAYAGPLAAALSFSAKGGRQRNIKARLVSGAWLAAAALTYFLPKRENVNAHHEIECVAIIPLSLCAITCRLLAILLHYHIATLPPPLNRVLLCFEYS